MAPVKKSVKTSVLKKKSTKTKLPAKKAAPEKRSSKKSASTVKPSKVGAKPTGQKLAAKKSPAAKGPKSAHEILHDAVLKILDDRQAEDIVSIDLIGKSSIADYLVIATGRNARQVSAMAGYLREVFFKHGIRNVRVEGQSEGNWVLVDGGDVVVHLFRPEVRRYYDLERIWDGKNDPAERREMDFE